MKICVISYDFWNYDRKIVDALLRKGIEATHIKMTAYRYPNFAARAKNAFSKAVLGKNLKKIHRQEMIMSELQKIGKQDQILVISPETIDPDYHEKIKKYTNRYIAYLYDSLARNPSEHLLHFFDDVFSFDQSDAEKHGLKNAFNYNYLSNFEQNSQLKYDLIYIGSHDERIKKLDQIAEQMDRIGKNYRFIIIGKHHSSQKKGFEFRPEKIKHHELPHYYSEAAAILDLVREGQDGLSFRPFEAMGLRKKLVTDNSSVKNYDFYDAENITVLQNNAENLAKKFFETPYQLLPENVYQKYTVENWVEYIFNLK